MKIVFLGQFLLDKSTNITGSQVQNYNLAAAFSRRGYDVHYLAITRNKKLSFELKNKIKVHWIQYNNYFFNWIWSLFIHIKILNEIKPDIIYQRGRSYLTYIAAKWAQRNRKKFVWASNGEDSCDFWRQIKRLQRSQRPLWKKIILFPNMMFQDLLIHKGIRGAHAYVNQTDYQKKQLQKNHGKQGIVIPSYFVAPSNRNNLKKDKIILWLANLNRNKQPEIFLELAENCINNREWQFLLGGGTKDTKYLQLINRKAKKLPNVKILGYVPFDKTDDLFAKASLFVNTSIREADGLPNSFIQAWLNKTPVLSLYHDPNNWIKSYDLGVCTNGDVKRFFKIAKSLIEDRKKLERIGNICAKFAREIFCSDMIINSYLHIFKKKH